MDVTPRQNAFVKVSGDMYTSETFIKWLEQLCKKYFVVVYVGGGTQINEMLGKMGIEPTDHGPLGRELETFELRQVARDVLELNQRELQNALAAKKIPAVVDIPVYNIGTVLCHVNGDLSVEIAYLGFDALYVVTTPDRLEKKKEQFAKLPKVEVVAF
jgi:acetylglutamate kinase